MSISALAFMRNMSYYLCYAFQAGYRSTAVFPRLGSSTNVGINAQNVIFLTVEGPEVGANHHHWANCTGGG